MSKLFLRTGATFVLGVCAITPSCIGPNNAYNGVLAWNSNASDSKFVNELAYIGLHALPVYPLALLGDMLIFNSSEFWTGSNLVNPPRPYRPQQKM